MSLNTYPYNPFPASADKLDEAHNAELQQEVDQLKSGLTNYENQNNLNLEVANRKNILNLSFEKIKALCDEGTWTGSSYVYNGVTYVFTVVDGYITKISISGTLTSNRSRVWIAYNEDITNYNGCILNGCPDLGGIDYISIQIQKAGTPYTNYAIDTGSGANINNIQDNGQIYISIGASFDSQTPVDVYPMIRPATITDPTFAPYIPSVESRIEEVESYTAVNTIYKPEQRAWSGSSLVYNIPLNSANMLHFIACASPTANTFVEAYFVLREQNQSIKVQKISEGLTITYDSTTKKTTVTLPSTDYWIERMEICARSV